MINNKTVARNLGTNVNGIERNWREMKETRWEKISLERDVRAS